MLCLAPWSCQGSTSTMPHNFLEEVAPLLKKEKKRKERKTHKDMYKPKTPKANAKANTTTQGTQTSSSPPTFLSLKSQRLTAGQLLADKVIPWRLKLQELFFPPFPKRSCSCFARELGRGGREDFSTCIHGASASANKVFPEEGGTGRRLDKREQRRRPRAKHTHTETHTHTYTRGVEGEKKYTVAIYSAFKQTIKGPPPSAKGLRLCSSCASSVNNATIKSLGTRWYGWPTQSASRGL